jgi:hypothetical protein
MYCQTNTYLLSSRLDILQYDIHDDEEGVLH